LVLVSQRPQVVAIVVVPPALKPLAAAFCCAAVVAAAQPPYELIICTAASAARSAVRCKDRRAKYTLPTSSTPSAAIATLSQITASTAIAPR